jgi:hypothetical protein
VIDPTTGQVWSEPWSATALPASVYASLSSSNQEFLQQGDRLYAVGGYSYDDSSHQFTTYDTLSAMSVRGMINMVMTGGTANGLIKQISDPPFALTGGDMASINGRMYLDFGQDFQGGYVVPANGNPGASLSQVYSDEIRSFRIIDHGQALGITAYQAQRDPVNFRRRDGNLAVPAILPNCQPGINVLGGVFTPAGNGYQQPIVIRPNSMAQLNQNYQQYFSQYDCAKVPLFDARTRTLDTVLFGGISLYDYSFLTNTLSPPNTGLPFVDDVTTLSQARNGSSQEYIMPSQLPGGDPSLNPQTLYGAEAAFFTAAGVPTYPNGVIKLNRIKGPTTIGYMFGGINSESNQTNPTPTNPGSFASDQMFLVTLTPSNPTRASRSLSAAIIAR